MADKLRITTESLSKDINSFRAGVETIASSFQSMRDEATQLHAMWEGASHDAFRTQFDTDMQMAMELVKELKDFAAKLETANDGYKRCSDQVNSYIDAISL